MGLQKTIQILLSMGQPGQTALATGLKVEAIPGYVARLNGLPQTLVMSDDDKKKLGQQMAQATQVQQAAEVQQQGAVAQATAPGGQQPEQAGPPPVPAQ